LGFNWITLALFAETHEEAVAIIQVSKESRVVQN
jgi:hypothetical protein